MKQLVLNLAVVRESLLAEIRRHDDYKWSRTCEFEHTHLSLVYRGREGGVNRRFLMRETGFITHQEGSHNAHWKDIATIGDTDAFEWLGYLQRFVKTLNDANAHFNSLHWNLQDRHALTAIGGMLELGDGWRLMDAATWTALQPLSPSESE